MRKQIKHGKIKTTAKKAGRFIAASFLVAGLMFNNGKAYARETGGEGKSAAMAKLREKEEQKKHGLKLTLGAGYDYFLKEPRTTALFNANISLPLRTTLSAALGIYVPLNGNEHPVGLEEFGVYLNTKVNNHITTFCGAFLSKHLWVDLLSPEGGIDIELRHGYSIALSYVYLMGLEKPHFLLLKAGKEFLDGRFGIVAKGGWAIGTGGSVRLGFILRPKTNFPEIGLDSIVMFTPYKFTFADSTLNVSWSF